jgi:hypothetical protein
LEGERHRIPAYRVREGAGIGLVDGGMDGFDSRISNGRRRFLSLGPGTDPWTTLPVGMPKAGMPACLALLPSLVAEQVSFGP